MADERTYNLPSLIGDETTFSFIMDKSGETSAVKVPFITGMQSIQSQISDNRTDINTNTFDISTNSTRLDNVPIQTTAQMNGERGKLVYSARIYELTNNVSGTTNKTEKINTLVTSIDTSSNNYYINLNEFITDLEDEIEVQVTANPATDGSTRASQCTAEAFTNRLTVYFNDSSANTQLCAFWIRIYDWR